MPAVNGHINGDHSSNTNYVSYRDPKSLGQSRIGSLDLEKSLIQPLAFASGAPLSDLYQVIEIGETKIKALGDIIPLSSVDLLAPINDRDILAVGKNYHEHAKEFNSSGFDSSDKVYKSLLLFASLANDVSRLISLLILLSLRSVLRVLLLAESQFTPMLDSPKPWTTKEKLVLSLARQASK